MWIRIHVDFERVNLILLIHVSSHVHPSIEITSAHNVAEWELGPYLRELESVNLGYNNICKT